MSQIVISDMDAGVVCVKGGPYIDPPTNAEANKCGVRIIRTENAWYSVTECDDHWCIHYARKGQPSEIWSFSPRLVEGIRELFKRYPQRNMEQCGTWMITATTSATGYVIEFRGFEKGCYALNVPEELLKVIGADC